MISFSLFVVSGTVLVTITVAKRIEEKRKRTIFVLKAISKGDERVREYHQKALEVYSEGKEQVWFWLSKHLPLRSKSLWYKLLAYAEEKVGEYLGQMRNARLLRRSDGLSEFFKNISEIEKGGGEINETYTELESLTSAATETIREKVSLEEALITPVTPTSEPVVVTPPAHAVQEAKVEGAKPRKKAQAKPRVPKVFISDNVFLTPTAPLRGTPRRKKVAVTQSE